MAGNQILKNIKYIPCVYQYLMKTQHLMFWYLIINFTFYVSLSDNLVIALSEDLKRDCHIQEA
jgi:hypothetical protein